MKAGRVICLAGAIAAAWIFQVQEASYKPDELKLKQPIRTVKVLQTAGPFTSVEDCKKALADAAAKQPDGVFSACQETK